MVSLKFLQRLFGLWIQWFHRLDLYWSELVTIGMALKSTVDHIMDFNQRLDVQELSKEAGFVACQAHIFCFIFNEELSTHVSGDAPLLNHVCHEII